MTATTTQLAEELLWSLWGEMGIPSPALHHRSTAIDPEYLIVYSPFLAAGDPRLQELTWSWCTSYGERYVSKHRLRGLHKRLSQPVAQAFEAFSATLATQTGTHRHPSPSDP